MFIITISGNCEKYPGKKIIPEPFLMFSILKESDCIIELREIYSFTF